MRLEVDATAGPSSIRIGFTDQRLTAYGGLVAWSHLLQQIGYRTAPREAPPPPTDQPQRLSSQRHRLGFLGGVLCGADKLSKVAWLAADPAVAEVPGIEAVPSQSSLRRFFSVFSQRTATDLGRLHSWAVSRRPSLKVGYTLDLDSWSMLHEDGHQEGVAPDYTARGIKPCLRPLVAALAEAKMIAGYWLRPGKTNCANGAAEVLRQTLESMPSHIRSVWCAPIHSCNIRQAIPSQSAFGPQLAHGQLIVDVGLAIGLAFFQWDGAAKWPRRKPGHRGGDGAEKAAIALAALADAAGVIHRPTDD